MFTTLISPLLITSITPVQQKQIAHEIRIQKSELSNTEKLKNSVIQYIFENKQDNLSSIKSELSKLLKLYKIKDFSQSELEKAARNLILFTKKHFRNKEVLEEAWYHWFPMAFWYVAYGALDIFDFELKQIGSFFNLLPTFVEISKIISNTLAGKYDVAAVRSFTIMVKLLRSMYVYEKENIIEEAIDEAALNSVSNFVENSDPRSLLIKFLTDIANNYLFASLNKLVQELISGISEAISFAKVKAWANYIYYYNLYWGINNVN
ncbi:hypothetical protein DR084_00505 [Mycoplasma flocculare]|nr:hypothetical protein [Mesomycoplasma flocculare]MXR13367.1 hypothetical protein [Mesomycoplasma flocculare]MXR22700.1 hypothetical protein [Mesomycoplasma flocculare]